MSVVVGDCGVVNGGVADIGIGVRRVGDKRDSEQRLETPVYVTRLECGWSVAGDCTLDLEAAVGGSRDGLTSSGGTGGIVVDRRCL